MSGVPPSTRIRRARAAQVPWAQLSVESRCGHLARLRRLISTHTTHILEVICEETGKVPLDALAGDIMVTLEQMRFYEEHAGRLLKEKEVGKPAFLYIGTRFYERFEPFGVVLVYAPSNYPFQLSVVPMISALFVGNSVILKCSERTPRVASLIESLCLEADLPVDVVQVAAEPPALSAAYLDAGPDMVFFTGSSEHGRTVGVRAAELLIPAVLELGGKDAALVFADCNLDRTIEGVTYGAFSNAGQVCVGIKRLYVEQPIYESFLRQFVDRTRMLRIGSSADSDLGPLSAGPASDRLRSQVEDAMRRGAKLHLPEDGAIDGRAPIVLTDVAQDSDLLVEETFGPVLCVLPFQNEEQAIALANSGPFALSASVWTGNRARGKRVSRALNTGTCAVNDVIRNIANPRASFGGNRRSGYGRYHGPQGLYAFSRIKSVMISGDRRKREVHWFPFSQSTMRSLRKLLDFRHGMRGLIGKISGVLFPLLICALCSTAGGRQAHLKILVTPPPHSHEAVAYLVFPSSEW